MNRRGETSYSASVGSVGTAAVPVAFTVPFTPPIKGKLSRLKLTITAGPALQVGARLREGAFGPIRVEWSLQVPPFDNAPSPFPVSYEVNTPSDMIIEVFTDDGTFGSTVLVEPEIEV